MKIFEDSNKKLKYSNLNKKKVKKDICIIKK